MNWINVKTEMPREDQKIDIFVMTGKGGFRVTDVTWCKDSNIFKDDFGSDYNLEETTHWRLGNDEPTV